MIFSHDLAARYGPALGAFQWRDAAGVAIWSAAALFFGWLFAPQLDAELEVASNAGKKVLVVAAALAVCFGVYRHWRRQTLLNIAKNHRITVHQFFELMARDPALRFFDIRSTEKRLIDPYVIEGSTLADESDMPALIEAIGSTRHPVIYCSCQNDVPAATTALELRGMGLLGAVALFGGLEAWRNAGRRLIPLELAAGTYTPG